MTPTDELIASIVDDLTRQGLVTARAGDSLRKKLASGSMTPGDWRNLISTANEDQEGAE